MSEQGKIQMPINQIFSPSKPVSKVLCLLPCPRACTCSRSGPSMDETSLVTEALFELSADLKLHMEIGLGDRDSHLALKEQNKIGKRIIVHICQTSAPIPILYYADVMSAAEV